MHQCQKWRPRLARLAGEASPAQPRAALAWLGLDNHGGGDDGDDGDQADGDGGDDDGDGGVGACEVPEVRCSAVRTQDSHHTPPPARTCAAVIQDVPLHATLRLLGWPLCHLLSSFRPCCSAIVHCGKCRGVGVV